MFALGVNLDHVATLRNVRGANDPSLLEMMFEVCHAGVNNITIHLREDRRHIQDSDLLDIKKHSPVPLNLEIALTDEMIEIALNHKPYSVCFVPEKREELTTEGGLNVSLHFEILQKVIPLLHENNIKTFIFVEPDSKILDKCIKLKVDGVELHTGTYARVYLQQNKRQYEYKRLSKSAIYCYEHKLDVHAGHGINYSNIQELRYLPHLNGVNIGHSIIARSLRVGLYQAIIEMKNLLSILEKDPVKGDPQIAYNMYKDASSEGSVKPEKQKRLHITVTDERAPGAPTKEEVEKEIQECMGTGYRP